MTEQTRSNLKMTGMTSSAGGLFGHVQITGNCAISGDVDCLKLRLVGQLDIDGGLRAGTLNLTGECAIAGSAAGELLSGRGEMGAAGVRFEEIKLHGGLEVEGDCEAERLHVNGALQVSGLLSAERLDIMLYGPCRATEIGGGEIRVRRSTPGKLLDLFRPRAAGTLRASSIEGDLIELEHTSAEAVRGDRVVIGEGCEIGRLEYRSRLDVHPQAVVRETIRLTGPAQ